MLARARPDDAEVIAIDPHAGTDRQPQSRTSGTEAGRRDSDAFLSNLRRAGVEPNVRYVRRHSLAALDLVTGPVDVLFIDGAHRYRPARDDIRLWGSRVGPGGTMLLHDAFNAIGVTGAQMRLLLLSADWRYCGRCGSLAEYRRERLSRGAILAKGIRHLMQGGYFVRNLLIKGALTLGLDPIARVLGYDGTGWPH